MKGQSLPFISFTVHHIYLIKLEIIFLTGKREMLLHTSFSIGGNFVLFQALSQRNLRQKTITYAEQTKVLTAIASVSH